MTTPAVSRFDIAVLSLIFLRLSNPQQALLSPGDMFWAVWDIVRANSISASSSPSPPSTLWGLGQLRRSRLGPSCACAGVGACPKQCLHISAFQLFRGKGIHEPFWLGIFEQGI